MHRHPFHADFGGEPEHRVDELAAETRIGSPGTRYTLCTSPADLAMELGVSTRGVTASHAIPITMSPRRSTRHRWESVWVRAHSVNAA